MTRYEGLPCTHCGEKFTKDDDVVVCPYCGAPYHRSCYKDIGECKYKDKHAEGYQWEIPIDQLPPERVTVCLRCKTPNPKENTFCSKCHARLSDDVRVISITKDENAGDDPLNPGGEVFIGEGDGISFAEAAAYTSKNPTYFLKRWRFMSAGKMNVSWNWPAFFFKFMYFFYRRMYLVGIIALALYAMLAVPSVMYSMEFLKMNSMELLGVEMTYNAELLKNLEAFLPTINILNIVYSLGCALFANKLYMKKAFKDIRNIKQKVTGKMNQQEYLATLQKVGKPDWLTVILLFFGFLMLYMKQVVNIVNVMLQ